MYFPPQNQMSQGRITDPVQAVRTMQIICGALMMGVLMFAGVAMFLRLGPNAQPPAAQPVIAYLAAGMAAIIFVARLVVVPIATQMGIKQLAAMIPLEELTKLDFYGVYQMRMIVGCALLEGAAFFNLISFILDGQLWTLGIVGGLLAIMATAFPTLERVDNWAEEKLRMLKLDPPS